MSTHLPSRCATIDNRWTTWEMPNQCSCNSLSRGKVPSLTVTNTHRHHYELKTYGCTVTLHPILVTLQLPPHTHSHTGPSQGLKKQKFSLRQLIKQRKKTSGPPKKKMFKVPLETIIINNQMPEILQEMLIRLYTEAPQTLGIFRQSANYRKVKDIKEALDNGEWVVGG